MDPKGADVPKRTGDRSGLRWARLFASGQLGVELDLHSLRVLEGQAVRFSWDQL